MGVGVKPFCLGLLKTLFFGVNKANLTYMAATSDFFGKFGPFAKSLIFIIFHALKASWRPQRPKMALGAQCCPKIQVAVWVWGSHPFVWNILKHFLPS